MVLVVAIRDYVCRMLNEVTGLKALLVDEETLNIVSLVMSQSEILHRDVYLVEKIDAKFAESTQHLKAVCFLRPTNDNINHVKWHLKNPKYGSYSLFFSNLIPSSTLHILADADESEVVQQVQEFYADFHALDSHLFSLRLPPSLPHHFSFVSATIDTHHTSAICERSVEALLSVCLALKRRPTVRYQSGAEMAKRVAQEAGRIMYDQEKPLFDFRRSDLTPVLLVLDRREDPITPLLNQWTYQAMVNELLGLRDNRVNLSRRTASTTEEKEFVLSAEQDEFFRRSMFDNFGEVSASVAQMVDALQKKDEKRKGVSSIADMAALLENFPEYRREAGTVSKHVALLSELQRIISRRSLMAVSQTEQELACSTASQAAAFEAVSGHLSSPSVSDVDKLRLLMLFALRYEKDSPRQVQQLARQLAEVQEPGSKYTPKLARTLLQECGSSRRVGDLFGNKDLLNLVARNVKRGLQGVENVYTQHQPLLAQTIDAVAKGRLREADYPFVAGGNNQQSRVSDVIVFIVGGATYEEARAVALYNAANPTQRVLLGGTCMLNSSGFISDLNALNVLESRAALNEELI